MQKRTALLATAVALGLVVAGTLTAQNRHQWPADTVFFTDNEDLQEKFDAGDLGGAATAEEISNTPSSPSLSASGWVATNVQSALDYIINRMNGEIYIWDADGDGSTYETCIAKDNPAPQCKGTGEVIYRDFVDDLNAILLAHPGEEITVRLGQAVYTGVGCWDATPAGTTPIDPGDPSTRANSTGDANQIAAYAHCQVDEFGEKLWGVHVRGRKLTLKGAGRDERQHVTLRNVGTVIAPDNGNYADDWWEFVFSALQNPYISVGMVEPTVATGTTNSKSGAIPTSYGTGKGWGGLTRDEPFAEAHHRRSICVCNNATGSACAGTGGVQASTTGWADTLALGDRAVLIIPETDTSSVGVVAEVGIAGRAASNGGNCGANSREVYLGVVLDGSGGNNGPSWGEIDENDGTGPAYLFVPTDDYWNGFLLVENLTIEPQDYRGEPGGDCGDTGLWTFGSPPGINDTDNDCDTNPYLIHYGGRLRLRNVTVKNGMSYTLDGGLVPGDAIMGPGVKWLYQNGEAVVDAGHFWKFEDVEVSHSKFAGQWLQTFGSYLTMRKVLWTDNDGPQHVMNITGRGNFIDDWRFQGNRMGGVISFGCGARNNAVSYLRITGWDGGHAAAGNRAGDGVFRFDCTNASQPITQNVFLDVVQDAPGIHWSWTGVNGPNPAGYRQRMIEFTAGSEAGVYGNVFERVQMPHVRTGSIPTAPTSAMFFVPAGPTLDAADIATLQGIASRNVFLGNVVETGKLFGFIDANGNTETHAIPQVAANGSGNMQNGQAAGVVLGESRVIEETGAGPFTYTATQMRGQSYYYSNVSTKTVNLPACQPGLIAHFYDHVGAAITIDPAGTEVIVLDGVPGAPGATITSPGARGNFITLECLATGVAVSHGISGAWSAP